MLLTLPTGAAATPLPGARPFALLRTSVARCAGQWAVLGGIAISIMARAAAAGLPCAAIEIALAAASSCATLALVHGWLADPAAIRPAAARALIAFASCALATGMGG